ncbi:MAG: PEP/pyruvate-binding domain-containing protein [Anaerolineales bacterium]
MTDRQSSILSLNSTELNLSNAGGKAANLAVLINAGFTVPDGFVLTTRAYRTYVEANQLAGAVESALVSLDASSPIDLEEASKTIRAAFDGGELPSALREEIAAAYEKMDDSPVAVRSSATAEDLPSASFAGQQDTFLHVLGMDSLMDAIVKCWSSLWTARAIGYRLRQGVQSDGLALAVVVQSMVDSEVSGVLFTANPLTGKRDQIVVDATFGLGEALVSGQIEPDHFVLDEDGKVILRMLGAKELAIRSRQGGGTSEEIASRGDVSSLSDNQLRELAQVGLAIAGHYGRPQDVEWAWAEDRLFILQSRPITTLYPIPSDLRDGPLRALLSFGSVQGLLDPMTPLGRDMIMDAFAGASELFGHRQSLADQSVLFEAGARLWADMTPMIENKIGRRLTLGALPSVDPAVRAILKGLFADGEFSKSGFPRVRTLISVLRLVWRVLPAVMRAARTPDDERARFKAVIDPWLAQIKTKVERADNLRAWLDIEQSYARQMFVVLLPAFLPTMVVGMASYNALIRVLHTLPEEDQDIELRSVMRALPGNVTTEMDMTLWRTAQTIRDDLESRKAFLETDPKVLAEEHRKGDLPFVAQSAVDDFIRSYGMRGLGEIDIGRRRWREAPQPVFEALVSFMKIEDPDQAPVAVYERGRQEAEDTTRRLTSGLRSTRAGWLKAKVAGGAAHRVRALLGARETPKFTIIRMYWLLRKALLEQGDRLVERGLLAEADDVFFLRLAELGAISRGEDLDRRELVKDRRQLFQREWNRRQVPRVLLSDGRALYRGLAAENGDDDSVLTGDPVSPGTNEGLVRVVLDPGEANLLPGEILVCPGTDPSWTPLFLAAGGLVMEVGGMMTHGAVVAREYGIPAVVGVDDATGRLQTGQMIRVDGSSGRVTVLSKLDDGADEKLPADPSRN